MYSISQLNGSKDKKFRTRSDLKAALIAMYEPLKSYYSPGCARVRLGISGATFLKEPAELEGFARPLWGLIPLLIGGDPIPEIDMILKGISNGTDPKHPEFWGFCHDRDQRLVELAVFGYALAACPDVFWHKFDNKVQTNLANWMRRINDVEMYDNNFWFFRVLVNLGLKKVNADPNMSMLKSDLNHIEKLYVGNGWYSDGHGPQFDYYNPWAMHYYGLLFSVFAKDIDPFHADLYRERANSFAKEFIHWFTKDGAAIPFGRSLTYRFCQSAFWGALAFANVDAFPWGIVKGLILRNLRWWADQPIFSEGGLLSIGYTYPNLNMAEGYNSPMSPYWALKSFIPLALPENHLFWQTEEEPLPDLPEIVKQNIPGFILCRDHGNDHVFTLSQRQYARGAVIPEFRHAIEKYSKFAYSSAFGFSVPAGRIGLRQVAYDNTLALSPDGEHYWMRERTVDYKMLEDCSYSTWQPIDDVSVETWLIPCLPWHIRLHRIISNIDLISAEGGFAVHRTGKPLSTIEENCSALVIYPTNWSGLKDILFYDGVNRTGKVIRAEPNTNLMFPRTLIPTLVGKHRKGEFWLSCAVIGVPGNSNYEKIWNCPPEVTKLKDGIEINHNRESKTIKI
jgi:hypothetical protein